MKRTVLAIVMSIAFLCLSSTVVLAEECKDVGLESTLVLNTPKSLTYGGVTYNSTLIAVNGAEDKATLNIDGETIVFEEGIMETLSSLRLATIKDVFDSTKESTPDTVKFQICKEFFYECKTATQTGIVLNIEKDLVYSGTTYTLELIAVNTAENKASIKVNGTTVIFQEGVETTLSDGRVGTIWSIFASTKASTPDSVWVQIGDSTYLDCDECGNPGEVTIVLNQLRKVIYSDITYALELMAVNTNENKATVEVNGTTIVFQEDVLTALSTGINATIEDIFASTKESTPDTVKFRFCDGDTPGIKSAPAEPEQEQEQEQEQQQPETEPEQEQEQEQEQQQQPSCASGCSGGLVCSESLNKCVRPATQFDSFKIVSIVTKLETYSIALDEVKADFERIQSYWTSVGDTDKARKWSVVINQTDSIIDDIQSLKQYLYDNRENLNDSIMERARSSISGIIDEMNTLAVLVLEASI